MKKLEKIGGLKQGRLRVDGLILHICRVHLATLTVDSSTFKIFQRHCHAAFIGRLNEMGSGPVGNFEYASHRTASWN